MTFLCVDVRGPSLYGAPLVNQGTSASSSSHTSFPVVVFSHGLGAMRSKHTALSCELASHGYVLACVEHRDRSACTTLKKVPKAGAPGEYEDEWLPMTFPGGNFSVKGLQQLPVRRQQVREENENLKLLKRKRGRFL